MEKKLFPLKLDKGKAKDAIASYECATLSVDSLYCEMQVFFSFVFFRQKLHRHSDLSNQTPDLFTLSLGQPVITNNTHKHNDLAAR